MNTKTERYRDTAQTPFRAVNGRGRESLEDYRTHYRKSEMNSQAVKEKMAIDMNQSVIPKNIKKVRIAFVKTSNFNIECEPITVSEKLFHMV